MFRRKGAPERGRRVAEKQKATGSWETLAGIGCGPGAVTSPFVECFLGIRDFIKLFRSSQVVLQMRKLTPREVMTQGVAELENPRPG